MPFYYFLGQLIILLVSAKLLAWLFSKVGIPPVLGELSAGVILGPSLINLIEPNRIFDLLSEVGVVFLLAEVGMHTDLSRLLSTGKKAFMVASTGFILPIMLGFGLAYLFGLTTLTALFIGGTLAATSIGITMRVLGDLGKNNTHEAHIVLGAAIIDDIFGILLLALLYNFAKQGHLALGQVALLAVWILLFMIVTPVIAKLILNYLERVLPKNIFMVLVLPLSLVLILGLSIAAHAIGAPTIIGGFVAGLALGKQLIPHHKTLSKAPWLFKSISTKNNFTPQLAKSLSPFIKIFTPIFFVMVGVSINFKSLNGHIDQFWWLCLGLILVAFISKFLAGFCIKEPVLLQTRIGVAMIPRGEVGLIFASLGLMSGILTATWYAALVLIVALTTFVPPFLLKFLYKTA